MAQKAKPASLTLDLLAPKGSAVPAQQSGQPGNGSGLPAAGNASIDEGIEIPVRLEVADHRALRLASARTGRSAQAIIIEALDRYLAEIAPDNDDGDVVPPGDV